MEVKQESKIPVIVIFAPTASGKTALTKELFSKEGSHFILNAEVISADSQVVYKGMDIGTAKPEPELQKIIPHHLIDILNPDEQYNVSGFIDQADDLCRDIYSRGKIPVVCGGTGFYIRSFLYGIPKTPQSDEKLRNQLKERIQKEGNAALYEELKKIDPQSAKKIHPNDSYRICRAMEVYYLTGKPRTDFAIAPALRAEYNFTFIVLDPPRELLYDRINQRVDQMITQGLEEEVKSLLEQGYTQNSPGLKAIGYQEWFQYPTKEEIITQIKHHTRKYAKKQYTYIRDIPGSLIIPFKNPADDLDKVCIIIKERLSGQARQ